MNSSMPSLYYFTFSFDFSALLFEIVGCIVAYEHAAGCLGMRYTQQPLRNSFNGLSWTNCMPKERYAMERHRMRMPWVLVVPFKHALFGNDAECVLPYIRA